MMRKNFISFQQCCFPFNVPIPISIYTYKNKCARLGRVSCCFLFPVHVCFTLFCLMLFSAPWPMWRRRRGARTYCRCEGEEKKLFLFFAAPQRRRNTSYWCNKWYIVTVSPRHCLWSVFLISKSRANLYGPLSSKTLHRSLALVENSSASQRSVIFLESNKCQCRIIIEFILVGCVLCKQRVSFPANEVISSWIWFNCLNYRNWEYNQKVSISSIFTAWTT